MTITVNVARANHDIANTTLNSHMKTCRQSCTVSGAPICQEGERLIAQWTTAGDEWRYAERMERINAGR